MRSLRLSALLGGGFALVSVPSVALESGDSAGRVRSQPTFQRSIGSRDAARLSGSLALGRGLRLNNPFRLETQIDEDPEHLSLTATYVDWGLGASFGSANGVQHGAVAHLSLALSGLRQEVASLSYQLLSPLGPNWLAWSRAGFPLVLEPDLGGGLELSVGAGYFVSAGLGLSAELVSSLFFGAATWESDPTLIPVLSLQVGAFLEYELLP